MKNKKKIIIVVAVFMILASTVFTMYFKNHGFIKLKGELSGIPVNTAFTDMNFYACIIDSYNKENNTRYGINHNMTDEELSSIHVMNCNDGSKSVYSGMPYEYSGDYNYFNTYKNEKEYFNDFEIKNNYVLSNLDGINKLTNLNTLIILGNNTINTVNLTNNANLKNLSIGTTAVRMINFSGLQNLESLELAGMTASNYSLSTATGLDTAPNLKKLKLKSISLPNTQKSYVKNMTMLEELSLNSTDFNDLSYIKDFEHLTKLSIINKTNSNSYSTSLSSFASLYNITDLRIDADITLGTLDDMPKLENLTLNKYYSYTGLDFSKIPNIKYLSIHYGNKLSDIPNITSLSKLEYLKVNDSSMKLDVLDSFPNLKYLEFQTNDASNVTSTSNTITNIYSNLNDYSKFPKAKVIICNSANSITNVPKSVEELYLDGYIGSSNLFYFLTEDYSNLKIIDSSTGIDPTKLKFIKNIEALSVDRFINDNDCYSNGECEFAEASIDLSLNPKLKYLDTETDRLITGFNNLTNLKSLILDYNIETYESLIDFDFNDISNIEYLILKSDYDYYNEINATNLEKLTKLKQLTLSMVKLDNANLENSPNLELIDFWEVYFDNLNLSSNNNLISLYLDRTSLSNGVQYMAIGERFTSFPKLQLPDGYTYKITCDSSELEQDGGACVAKELGETYLYVKIYNPYSLETQSAVDSVISLIIMEYKFKTFLQKNDYLFTGTTTDEEEITDDYIISEDRPLLAFVDRNTLKITPNLLSSKNFKIINISSSKYKIDESKIKYNGTFDVNNIRVKNANAIIDNNKLKIMYNDELIKEYELVENGYIIGDVNNDGKISIADIASQYKYVKYSSDFNENEEYRADVNRNDDVTIADVTMLYKYIKKVISEF